MPEDPKYFPLPFVNKDQLRFTSGGNFQLIVQATALDQDSLVITGYTRNGAFTFRPELAGGVGVETFTFRLDDVPISLSAQTEDDLTVAEAIYVRLLLGIQSDPIVVLTQGFVSENYGIAFPQVLPASPASEARPFTQIGIENPAAGEEFVFTNDTAVAWEIVAVQAMLDTDANAANRLVSVGFMENFGPIRSVNAQTANTDRMYVWAKGMPFRTVDGGTPPVEWLTLPETIVIAPGDNFGSDTVGIQVGDQWTGPTAWVRQFRG